MLRVVLPGPATASGPSDGARPEWRAPYLAM